MAKKLMSRKKFKKVMKEFEEKQLHTGSKHGPVVTNPKQAVAIALSESRKAGEKVKPAKKGKKTATKSEKTLHKKEERQHEIAEKAMKADEKIHEKIEKKHKSVDKKPKKKK